MDFKQVVLKNIPNFTTFELAEIKRAIEEHTGVFPTVYFPDDDGLLSTPKPKIKDESIDCPKDFIEKVHAYCRSGQKLQAMKYVKDQTGWGLKESRDFVDGFHSPIGSISLPPVSKSPVPLSSLTKAFYNEIEEFLKRDDFMGAVKFTKDETGWGLKESIDYVDELIPPVGKLYYKLVPKIIQEAQNIFTAAGQLSTILYLRKKVGWSLLTARNWVDDNCETKHY